MKPAAYITTSWDDGHPLDFRIADLLARYGLRGTFYVPRSSEFGTMSTSEVQELSRHFEIGAHTIHHVDLTRTTDQRALQEMVDSRCWLEDSTGKPCSMFCAPQGKFFSKHLELMRLSGYVGMRTVELLSLDLPRCTGGLLVMPTTVQAYPHGLGAYVKSTFKRAAFGNLCHYLTHGRSTDWVQLARSMVDRVLQWGGVFHLWGHSWELQETGQWQRLEELLGYLGQFTVQAAVLTNFEVCQAVANAA